MGEVIQDAWTQKHQGGRKQLIFIFLAKYLFFSFSLDDFL